MSDTSYVQVNGGRDVMTTWQPVRWLRVDVAYTGHIVGFRIREPGHTRQDALESIVAAAQLDPETLRVW